MEWFSAKEKPPFDNGEYLVTVEISHSKSGRARELKTAFYHKSVGWLVHESEYCIIGEVVAWAFPPEVYRGE